MKKKEKKRIKKALIKITESSLDTPMDQIEAAKLLVKKF